MNIPENFDRWMFDYKEGNLSGAEKAAFENFLIQHPEYEIEADAWNNSFVQNQEFVYEKASELERDRFVAGWYGYAAAAVVFLLIGTSVMYFTRSGSEVNGFSASHEVVADGLDHSALFTAHGNDQKHSELIEVYNSNVDDESLNIALSNNNAHLNDNQSVDNQVVFSSPNNNYSDNQNYSNGNSPDNDRDNLTITDGLSVKPNRDGYPLITIENANQMSMDQELSKFDDVDNNSKYQNNPNGNDLNFDIASANLKSNFSGYNKWKKFTRKIERMFEYPVGLTNLRDPDYLMPNTSVLASNPGFTGGMLRPRTEINYRNQWFGADQNSQKLTVSFDNYFYQLRGGVGLVLNAKDYNYGHFGDYSVSMTYSPKIVLAQNVVFEPAVKLTLGALNANGDKLAPESSMELDRGRIISTPAAQQMTGDQQLWYKDYGVGFVLNTKWFYTGLSADNLNKHYENVYNEEGYATPTSSPVLINAIAGFDYESINKKFAISPFVTYQKFGDRQEIWAGTSMRINKFIVGGSVDQKLDFTASIGLKFEKFKLAYQYDQTRTTLTNESIGSHNLTLRFNGKSKPPRLK